MNRDLKIELVNELAFLINIQEKIWQYHPDNKDQVDVIKEYSRIEEEIKVITNQLDK
jgi:hypothetical protein|tara:strand:+ start:728 stop:898 length:171 start_codon:yes stop_codon:yes gene_type:complete